MLKRSLFFAVLLGLWPLAAQAIDVEEILEKKPRSPLSVFLLYEFAHNVSKERPTLTNQLMVQPMYRLPYNFLLGGYLGLLSNYRYGQEGVWGSEANSADVDFNVSYIYLRHTAFDHKKSGFALMEYFTVLMPFTSRYQGVHSGWYLALKPHIRLQFSYKDLLIYNTQEFQVNFHKDEEVVLSQGEAYNLSQYRYATKIYAQYTLYNVTLAAMFGFIKDWIYNQQLTHQADNKLYYLVELSYHVWRTLTLALGYTTYGAERINGGQGNDLLYPGHPRFSQMYMDLSYTF